MADSKPSQASDRRILDLNEQIQTVLLDYVEIDKAQIRFDMPDQNHPPDTPTICVFLYDIQEDMKVRHSYPDISRPSVQRYTSVKCCYLLTYWDPLTSSASGPASQTMKVMNQLLNALLNLEARLNSSTGQEEVSPILTRVIEPSEHLAGLGNLWQSLGNKPRLCLNLAVTVPIKLALATNTTPAVSQLQLDTQPNAVDTSSTEAVLRAFNAELIKQVAPRTMLERAQLEKLQVTVLRDTSTNQRVINLVGTLAPSLYDRLNSSSIKVVVDSEELQLHTKDLKKGDKSVVEL